MEQYVIKGGNPLNGEVEIGGAKNAALAILAAAIMTDETVTIENLPNVRDINVLLQAIAEIGAMVDRIDAHTVKINGSFIKDVTVDNEFIRRIRASYYLIGALLRIIFSAPSSDVFHMPKWLFRADAISEADRLICISKDFVQWEQTWILHMVLLLQRQKN